MSDRTEPALSAEEWAAGRVDYGLGPIDSQQDCAGHGYHVGEDGRLYYEIGYEGCDRTESVERPHALAALALHGQPFGFTWEDVDLLLVAIILERYEAVVDHDETAKLEAIAARLASLLPPREP